MVRQDLRYFYAMTNYVGQIVSVDGDSLVGPRSIDRG